MKGSAKAQRRRNADRRFVGDECDESKAGLAQILFLRLEVRTTDKRRRCALSRRPCFREFSSPGISSRALLTMENTENTERARKTLLKFLRGLRALRGEFNDWRPSRRRW